MRSGLEIPRRGGASAIAPGIALWLLALLLPASSLRIPWLRLKSRANIPVGPFAAPIPPANPCRRLWSPERYGCCAPGQARGPAPTGFPRCNCNHGLSYVRPAALWSYHRRTSLGRASGAPTNVRSVIREPLGLFQIRRAYSGGKSPRQDPSYVYVHC